MASLSWSLLRELSVEEWKQVSDAVRMLAEKGLPLLLQAQTDAPLEKGWKSFLARRQRELFVKMNRPAFAWGLDGTGPDSVRLVLLPGPFSTDDPQHAQQLAIRVARLPHQGHVEVGQRLYAFAWLGALLWEHHARPGIWRFQTDLVEEDLAAVRAWAFSMLSNN